MKFRFLTVLGFSAALAAQVPSVLTRGADNARSGSYQESIITPASIRAGGLTLRTTVPVIGDARGMEAQPLVAPGVAVAYGDTRDVMILPSMANVVRGVDAHTGAGIWQTAPLCTPIKSDSTIDMWGVNDHFGALSTGVIDADTGKLYQVVTCSENGSGSPSSMRQRMFVLAVDNGSILANVLIDGTSGNQRYSQIPRKQRSSLLLTNHNGIKFVWFAAGSFSETGTGSTGWVLGFDTYDDQIKMAWASSQGRGAGIWMSGQGIVEDNQNRLYVFTGNGAYDGITDFGESTARLIPTYPTAIKVGTLTVDSSWARFSDAGRVGQDPTKSSPSISKIIPNKIAGMSAPSTIVGAAMPMPNSSNAAFGDQDDGLSHTLVSAYGKYLGAGKDGIGVVIDINKFPHTQPADFANAKANCAKLAGGPYALGWPISFDFCPQDQTQLNNFPSGKTRHIHSPMVQYKDAKGTQFILVWAENSQLHAWQMTPEGKMIYVAQSNEFASPQSTAGTGGMPGGFCAAATSGVLFCSVPDGDANRTVTTGRMYAYDISGLSSLKGAAIPLLWTSQQYVYNKFSSPVIWNGEVILPNYSGGVMVFGQ